MSTINTSLATTENSGMSVLPQETTTLENFQMSAFGRPVNRLTAAAMKNGTTDTLLHAGTQLLAEDVAGHALTIVRVGYASAPARDVKGNPIYKVEDGKILTDENGEPIQEVSLYPVCHFKEAPGYWYNGGTMLKKNIEVWAQECGDDGSDLNFPEVNKALEEIGGIQAFFAWKEKRDGSGQKYMNIILA